MTKRTYQPNKRKRATTHGFLVRMARKKTGKVPSVISKRRHKGRKLLAPTRKKK